MPAPATPQHHRLVHQLLHHAHALLEAANDNEEAPTLATLLARAADHVPDENRARLDPSSLAYVVADAAAQLLACTRTPIQPQDPNLTNCLQALDRLPRTARAGLLAAAARHTTPDTDSTTSPTPSALAQAVGSTATRRRTAGRCPCPCSNGDFCGGCGHAGCGGRR